MNKKDKKTNQQIRYNGKVKVSIQKDNKIIASKTYHNEGSKYLYQFLCYCLAGDFDSVKNYRPFKIKLFKNKRSVEHLEPDLTSEASSFIAIDQKPDVLPIKNDELQTINYKTVLHFLIPYSFIFQDKINQICLYSINANTNEDYSAIYYLVNEDVDPVEWDWIDITTLNNSVYNLIIEWEMSFELN